MTDKKKSRLPNKKEIEKLISYRPRLYQDRSNPIKQWNGGEKVGNIKFVSWPEYEDIVIEFMQEASKPCWCDYGYIPEDAAEMVENQRYIESASLEEIKSMLTFCIRSERFCDGSVGRMIEDGKIGSILKRLEVIISCNSNTPDISE